MICLGISYNLCVFVGPWMEKIIVWFSIQENQMIYLKKNASTTVFIGFQKHELQINTHGLLHEILTIKTENGNDKSMR